MKQDPELVLWVRAMARMGARAGSISVQCDLPIGEARRIYKQEMGRSSPSGQNPGSVDWYLKTPLRRYQSALLLQLYGITRDKLDLRIAFANAYYHFSRMMAGEVTTRVADPAMRPSEDDYSFPYQRGQFLVNYYSDNKDIHGRHICDLALRRCNSCMSVFLSSRAAIEPNCPACAAH